MPKVKPAKLYEIQERRKVVSDLYLKGKTQWEIAKVVGRDQGTVSEDLKAIRKEWAEKTLADFSEAKAEELAKIDLIESAAWEAWMRSCEPATSRSVKVEKGPKFTKPSGENGRIKLHTQKVEEEKGAGKVDLVVLKKNMEQTRKGQAGNPAFLDRVSWCVETRLKIMGVFKEEKKGGDVNVFNINWDAMVERPADDGTDDPLERRIASVKQLAPPPEPVNSFKSAGAVEDAEVVSAAPAKGAKKRPKS
jgi:hypothetical protein